MYVRPNIKIFSVASVTTCLMTNSEWKFIPKALLCAVMNEHKAAHSSGQCHSITA